MSSIAENLARVEDAIAAACRQAGRTRETVRLMAVSKTHPVELLLEAAAAGQRLFGENRVQEFGEKSRVLASTPYAVNLGFRRPDTGFNVANPSDIENTRHPERSRSRIARPAQSVALRAKGPAFSLPPQAPPSAIDVHLIGHLQSNKSARAAELFSAIDTIDSLKLAERLHASAAQASRILPILLEIKLSPEEAKEGLDPKAPELQQLLERLPNMAVHLPFRGLMTVPPVSSDPAVARTCFRRLRELREELARRHPRLCFDELSMGMSGDFEAAIAEGSTTIRIGTAIFGARPKPAA